MSDKILKHGSVEYMNHFASWTIEESVPPYNKQWAHSLGSACHQIALRDVELAQLREALENVYNVGMQGIGYVGAANYPERERKAFDDLQKAMDAARALKGGE